MDPIRVGIIGQGRSGRDIHGFYLSADSRFRIVAVADTLADRRERAIKEYGCEAHADAAELLARKDVDLIVNSSFSYQHVPLTLKALNRAVRFRRPAKGLIFHTDRGIEYAAGAFKQRLDILLETIALYRESEKPSES